MSISPIYGARIESSKARMIRLIRRKRWLQIACVFLVGVVIMRTVERHQAEKNAVKYLPHAFIMGAPRTGATALSAFIGLHPGVKSVNGRATNFFGNPENYNNGVLWYTSRLPRVNGTQLLVENSPQYYYSSESARLMKELYPDADSVKIIIVVRDPLKRLLSEYADITAKERVKGRKVDSFYKSVIDAGAQLVNTSYQPVKNGIYALGLQNWLAHFSKEQIHYVDGENFISDPIEELEKVENFLGLKHVISEDHLYFNKASGFFCVKQASGRHRCFPRAAGYQEPRVDHRYLDIVRLFYVHHNNKLTLLSGEEFDWQDDE